eukprot:Skav218787  [mRNA]  locus=scaffold1140:18925:19331:- [translate_table: standard]
MAPVAGKIAGLAASHSSARVLGCGNSFLYRYLASATENASPGSSVRGSEEKTGRRFNITSKKVVGIGAERALDLAGQVTAE